MDLIFLTSNKEKLREVGEILGSNINVIGAEAHLNEIQEVDGKEVITKKAEDGFELLKKPLIVEDTSLYITAWNGLPGALNRWFMKTVGNEGIIKMLGNYNNKEAFAHTIFAYHDGKNVNIFEGRVRGRISDTIKGDNGFGWDKIFIPDDSTKTQAEMTSAEKNRVSARKIALDKLRKYLFKSTVNE